MQAVKDWVFMLLASSIIGSVLMYIVPEGGMNKYVKFVSGLCAAAIAVIPIAAAVRQAPAADLNLSVPEETLYSDNAGRELIVRQTVSMLEDETCKMIYEKTSINPANIYIYIEQAENSSSADKEDGELIISGVKAVLKEEDMTRSGEVYLCLRAFLDCEAEVTAGG